MILEAFNNFCIKRWVGKEMAGKVEKEGKEKCELKNS